MLIPHLCVRWRDTTATTLRRLSSWGRTCAKHHRFRKRKTRLQMQGWNLFNQRELRMTIYCVLFLCKKSWTKTVLHHSLLLWGLWETAFLANGKFLNCKLLVATRKKFQLRLNTLIVSSVMIHSQRSTQDIPLAEQHPMTASLAHTLKNTCSAFPQA